MVDPKPIWSHQQRKSHSQPKTFPWKQIKEKKKNSNDVEVERKEEEILEIFH